MMTEKEKGESIESQETAYVEGQKLVYDTFKHLTTINTGSILLLVAFIEKLFTNPRWKVLITVAFISFIISTVCSIFMMIMIAGDI
ncbi:MAG: hypothetical protein M3261_00410, partial [Thermoproteota archaeon]|nr:hypothetical protein [Thermoproteota archaeon]